MKSKTILVVDDEIMLVEMIKMRLEGNGYVVITATDGLEGLSMARRMHPDLIILDISMTGMDGYSMLKEVRQDDQIKETPVIMLTASGKKRDLFESLGISDYITKPFDTEDFLSRVKKIFKEGKD